ncbi:MAG: hypothetical protein ABH859_05970 [Pseudomonadota bacterium]
MKNMKTFWRVIAVVAITILASACSDGELKFGSQLDIVPPEILIDFTADPAEINEGGSTTLKWDVKNATHIQISGKAITEEAAAFAYNFETEEMTGEVVVDGIPATIDFTMTATTTIDLPAPTEEEQPEGNVSEEEGDKEEVAEEDAKEEETGEEETEEAPVAYTFKKMGQIPVGITPEVQPNLVPTTISGTKTVRVTVTPASDIVATIAADQENISAGQSTVIRWNYSQDLTATVTSSTNQIIEAQADCANLVGIEGVISECATVSPNSTTTYALNAVDASGKEYTAAVTVNVEEVDLQAEIRVNGSDGFYTVSSYMESFQVTWNVTPENALVTITAEPEAQCDNAFPVEVESASGSATCTVSPNAIETNFTIVATLGDSQDTSNVIVKVVGGSGGAPLDINAKPWAVESEEIEVEIGATNAAQVATIESVKVCGQTIDKEKLAEGTKAPCRVTNKGAPVEVKYAGVEEPKSQQAVESFMQLTKNPFFHNVGNGQALPVTKVVIDQDNIDIAYYGVQRPEFGEISVYKVTDFVGSMEYAINIEDAIKQAFDLQDLWQHNGFFDERAYPVGAIAFRQGNESQMFAASTGIMMYSNDAGTTWNRLDAIFYLRKDNYDGKTCAGKSQADLGAAMNTGNQNDIVALGQVCDMIVKPDGRMIVAFDYGLAINNNIDAFIAKPGDSPWQSGAESDVSATVAHDLEEVGNKIYAATNKGVYVNDGSSNSWQPFIGGEVNESTPVYSLAYNERSNQIYAGGANAVYVTAADSANWTKTQDNLGGLVLSLAVDPYAPAEKPVVVAGTSSGLAITRNGGNSWSKLTSPAATDLAEVRSVALAAKEENGNISYKLSATGSGYVTGSATVGSVPVLPANDAEDNTPANDNEDVEAGDETEDEQPLPEDTDEQPVPEDTEDTGDEGEEGDPLEA